MRRKWRPGAQWREEESCSYSRVHIYIYVRKRDGVINYKSAEVSLAAAGPPRPVRGALLKRVRLKATKLPLKFPLATSRSSSSRSSYSYCRSIAITVHCKTSLQTSGAYHLTIRIRDKSTRRHCGGTDGRRIQSITGNRGDGHSVCVCVCVRRVHLGISPVQLFRSTSLNAGHTHHTHTRA